MLTSSTDKSPAHTSSHLQPARRHTDERLAAEARTYEGPAGRPDGHCLPGRTRGSASILHCQPDAKADQDHTGDPVEPLPNGGTVKNAGEPVGEQQKHCKVQSALGYK